VRLRDWLPLVTLSLCACFDFQVDRQVCDDAGPCRLWDAGTSDAGAASDAGGNDGGLTGDAGHDAGAGADGGEAPSMGPLCPSEITNHDYTLTAASNSLGTLNTPLVDGDGVVWEYPRLSNQNITGLATEASAFWAVGSLGAVSSFDGARWAPKGGLTPGGLAAVATDLMGHALFLGPGSPVIWWDGSNGTFGTSASPVDCTPCLFSDALRAGSTFWALGVLNNQHLIFRGPAGAELHHPSGLEADHAWHHLAPDSDDAVWALDDTGVSLLRVDGGVERTDLIGSSGLASFLVTDAGTIWAGGTNGDSTLWQGQRAVGAVAQWTSPVGPPAALLRTVRGDLVLAGDGLFIRDPDGKQCHEAVLNCGRVLSLALDTNGNRVFVGTQRGGVYRVDPLQRTVETLQDCSGAILSLEPSDAGLLLTGTQGLVAVRSAGGWDRVGWRPFTGPTAWAVNAAWRDELGTLWVAPADGQPLVKLDGGAATFRDPDGGPSALDNQHPTDLAGSPLHPWLVGNNGLVARRSHDDVWQMVPVPLADTAHALVRFASPQETAIVISGGTVVTRVEPDGGTNDLSLTGVGALRFSAAWGPDPSVFYACAQGAFEPLWRWQAGTWSIVDTRISGSTRPYDCYALTGRGSELFLGMHQGVVLRVPLDGGSPVQLPSGQVDDITAVRLTGNDLWLGSSTGGLTRLTVP
jgi:hypothetical protein